VGFDDHKQDVYNLVQALKILFLYTQSENESIEEYGQNFRSLWDMVEAFGGLPGIHRGLTDTILKPITTVGGTVMAAQLKKAEEELSEAVKAALLISGANCRRYGALKDTLANNYLLGSDQYPGTFDKAMRVLGNYQVTKTSVPYRTSPDDTGVAFLQQGGRGGHGGWGGQGGKSNNKTKGSSDDVSTITGKTGDGPRTNSKGESHCFNCGSPSHWANECPQLGGEQQA
jgi:hypothetical protein